MEPDEFGPRVAVFLVAVVVVVAGVTGASMLRLPGQGNVVDDHAGYEVGEILPDRTSAEGTVDVDPVGDRGVVAIDRMHGNRVTDSQMRVLVSAISRAGYEVMFVNSESEFEVAMRRADAMVTIDPGFPYTSEEATALESFVEDGGRLVMMAEPTRGRIVRGLGGAQLIPAQNHLSSLSSRFGIEFGDGYLYNMRHNDGNFKHIFALPGRDAALTAGLDQSVVYTATYVEADDATPVLVASAGTQRSGGGVPDRAPIAVRKGNVLAVGDTTFLERDKHAVADNERVVAAITSFLVSGTRTRDLEDYPYVVAANATVGYSAPALLNATQRLANDLRAADRSVTLQPADRDGAAENATVLVTTYDYLRRNQISGTGIEVDGDTVSVDGFTGSTASTSVVVAPDSRFDLVVAADSRAGVDRMIRVLAGGKIEQYALSNSTAAIQNPAARNGTTNSGRSGGSGGTGDGGGGGSAGVTPSPAGPTPHGAHGAAARG